jgi:hypothetical protein
MELTCVCVCVCAFIYCTNNHKKIKGTLQLIPYYVEMCHAVKYADKMPSALGHFAGQSLKWVTTATEKLNAFHIPVSRSIYTGQ